MNYSNLILKPEIRSGLALSCLLAVFSLPAFAAEKPGVMAPEDMTRRAIQERVAVLRSERIEKMPYLDKAFIRAAINEKTYADKQTFVLAGPQSLQNILDRAVRVYLPARVAHEKEVLAKRRILVALRNLFPEAAVEITQQDGHLSGSPFNHKNFKVKLKQPVFHGGILWNTLLKEKAVLRQNAREREQIIADLIQDVSQAYFEYQRALMVVEERKGILKEISHYSDISEKKWNEKIISEIEYLNVESLASQLDYDYESAIQEFELARLELQKFLELDIDDSLDIVRFYDLQNLIPARPQVPASPSKKAGPKPEPALEEGEEAVEEERKQPSAMTHPVEEVKIPKAEELIDMAYENRPELQLAAARLRAARLEEKIQWGATLPEVDVIIEYGKNAESFNDVTADPSYRTEYKIGMEFSWNLAGNKAEYTFTNEKRPPSVSTFQGGAGSQTTTNLWKMGILDGLDVFANVKNAEVEKLEQVVELDEAEKEVIKSVKEAYYEFQRASIQLKSGLQRLNYRERLLRLSQHRLEKNEIEVSEYLQSMQEFLNQKVEVHQTLADYYTAKAKLNRAVGSRDFLTLDAVDL